MIYAALLAATLAVATPATCPDGQCYQPRIRIRVPGVKIDVRPSVPPVRLVPAPTPYRIPAVYRRGWFGKWKYKAKVRRRSW